MLPTYDDTTSYLETRYLTLPQLASAARLSEPRVEALIAAGCLPGHSHEAWLSLRVEAVINGSHPTADKRVRYYHPDLVDLAVEADHLAVARGMETAARFLRERHDDAVAQAASLRKGTPEHVSLADRAWAAWRDGTFGVCLLRISTEDMIRKVQATEQLKAMLEGRVGPDAAALDRALTTYAAVTGPFGPHERHGSTRALVYEPALALQRSLGANAA
jgi:hypothetical protein